MGRKTGSTFPHDAWRSSLSRLVRIVAFGMGLLGGVVASQGPEFGQQYRQRLGGAVDELRQVISRFER
ncbi:MAG: DUF2937 family protein, partial [Microvirga sp.]